MKLIDKDVLVAEIERLISEIYEGQSFDSLSREKQVALWYVKSIMSSINTLEVKEVDLEKLIDDYMLPITAQDVKEEPFTQLEKCAKHFFELGMQVSSKAQKGES